MGGLTRMDALRARYPQVQRVMKPFSFEALVRSIELMLKAERAVA